MSPASFLKRKSPAWMHSDFTQDAFHQFANSTFAKFHFPVNQDKDRRCLLHCLSICSKVYQTWRTLTNSKRYTIHGIRGNSAKNALDITVNKTKHNLADSSFILPRYEKPMRSQSRLLILVNDLWCTNRNTLQSRHKNEIICTPCIFLVPTLL